MTSTEAAAHAVASRKGSRSFPANGAVVLIAALFMTWPALYNRFPLLYPDSMTYLDNGRQIARALFLHQLSPYYGMRSFIYSLGILPLHRNVTLWPVIAFNAILSAFVLWLVVRSILPRRAAANYLLLIALLSLFTSLSWYVSLVMPDILGPVLYLCIYLLVFVPHSLSRAERLTIDVIAWWAVASHASHLILAAGLCLLLMPLLLLERREMRRRLLGIAEVAVVLAVASAAHLALNGYLNGEPTINGERPPFLTARIIADGPGRWYLQQHCAQLKWLVCEHVGNLPDDADDFLWAPDGILQTATPAEEERLRHEEMPFVMATLRAYPRQQLARSAINAWHQLKTFGLYDLDPSGWVLDTFEGVLPKAKSQYVRGRQARNLLHFDFFTTIQYWTVLASIAAIFALAPGLWRRAPSRLAWLGVVIVSIVLANAYVTGAMSMVDDRFECRVIWLVPFLAGLMALDRINSFGTRNSTGDSPSLG